PIRLDDQPVDPESGKIGLPYLLLVTDEEGNVTEAMGDTVHFTVDPTELTDEILAEPDTEGELPQYNLRYLRQPMPDGWKIACHDLEFEQKLKLSTLGTSILIGSGTIVVFFLLSLIFANWAVRPVEQAWYRQKQFIADASHEMKTPLTVILSNADMLERQTPADNKTQAARWIENIHVEGTRLRRLVESMLFLARSDAAISTAPRQRMDWSDAVESSVLTFEPLIFEHGLEIESHITPACFVLSNPDDLRRLSDILLDNAVKYALPGGKIEVNLVREPTRYALLTVSNPSAKITEHQAEKLFDRFYRLDPARAEQSGYGLGLSIAKSMVKMQKGKIWMSYQDGHAIFCVKLPIEK
ncbi:MAG: HAMP domain-containing sensor histidine kinase, partial [Butyricicoccus sp.]|nr:HAMP domain-containing sensor histidine kinase [Butyricicoccus sp.]